MAVLYPKGPLIEQHVAIGAKAEQIPQGVRPIVGPTQWLDVSSFGIRA